MVTAWTPAGSRVFPRTNTVASSVAPPFRGNTTSIPTSPGSPPEPPPQAARPRSHTRRAVGIALSVRVRLPGYPASTSRAVEGTTSNRLVMAGLQLWRSRQRRSNLRSPIRSLKGKKTTLCPGDFTDPPSPAYTAKSNSRCKLRFTFCFCARSSAESRIGSPLIEGARPSVALRDGDLDYGIVSNADLVIRVPMGGGTLVGMLCVSRDGASGRWHALRAGAVGTRITSSARYRCRVEAKLRSGSADEGDWAGCRSIAKGRERRGN